MTDLRERIDVVREAVVEAHEVLPRDLATRAAEVLSQVDSRLGHLGETVVVALAGGTGSGKSSILNALAGERVVDAGVLRPTTDHATAWIPTGAESGLLGLLADLGITEVVRQDVLPHLAVVDLPDLDSVEEANRRLADALVRRVDAVVWVLDPTKYNDALVHDQYLRPRHAHAAQFVVAVNQIDRLTTGEWADVESDLRATMARDGLDEVPVIGVAADPPDGTPRGLDDLKALVAGRFRAKQAALAKLEVDVAELVHELSGVFGATAAVPPREQVFAAAADEVASGVIDEAEVGRAGDVGARVAGHVAAGPIGLLGSSLRASPLGRVVGLRRDVALDTRLLPTASKPSSLLGPASTLQEWVTDLAVAAGGELGMRIRLVAGDLDDVVHAASSEARAAVPQALEVPRRTPWVVMGVVRTLLAIAIVGALVTIWSDPSSVLPGGFPTAVVVVVVAVAAWVLIGRLASASGRRAGETLAREHRARIAAVAVESLDFRLGRPVDDVLATRDRLRDALARVGVERDDEV